MAKRLLISGNFSIEVLEEGMRFWASRLAWPIAFAYTGYNGLLRDLLDPASDLHANRDGLNVLVVDPDDPALDAAAPPSILEALAETAAAAAHPLQLAVLHSRQGGRGRRLLAELRAIDNLELLGPDQLRPHLGERATPLGGNHREAHVPFGRDYWLALSIALARKLDAQLRPPRKVLVLDCDQTLWGGILGEEGPQGIRVGPSHRALQQRALELASRGWLLCLNSKNDDRDLAAAFGACPGMLLNLDQFAARRVNWSPKAENLISLASELKLGLDTFVFVDDSPLECARVRAELPEVCTLCLPPAAEVEDFLDSIWVFDAAPGTAEDALRASSYRHQRGRAELRDGSTDFSAFFNALELDITIAPATGDDAARISQLSHRTNQFNATGLKLSEAQARRWIESPDQLVLVTRVRDRFGDYGRVGALLAGPAPGGLTLEGFYLSCRALDRGVEHAMCAALGRAAAEGSQIRVNLQELPRNVPARRYFRWLANHHRCERNDGHFEIDAAALGSTAFDPRIDRAAEPRATVREPDISHSPAAQARVDYDFIARSLSGSAALAAVIDAEVRARPDIPQCYVPPAPGIQTLIAGIWRQVLHVAPVGIDDEFEHLGGRSIQLVEIHRQIRQRCGGELELTDLFRYPTVRALAEFLASPQRRSPSLTQERARRQIAARRRLASARRPQGRG